MLHHLDLREHRVVLSPRRVLRGRVVAEGMIGLPADTRVYAWPKARGFMTGDILNDRVLATSAQLDGSFEIADAGDGEEYSIVAGSYGWCAEQSVVAVANGPSCTVNLWRVFGARVKIEATQLPGWRSSLGKRYRDAGGRESGVALSQSGWEIEASQTTWLQLQSDHEFDVLDTVVIAKATQTFPALSTQVRYAIPGFRRISLHIDLPPTTAALPTYSATLERESGDLGDLVVTAGPPPSAAQQLRLVGDSPLELTLRRVDDDVVFVKPLRAWPVVTLCKVPTATYKADLYSRVDRKVIDLGEVVVGAGISSLSLPTAGFGSVSITIQRAEPLGARTNGYLQMRLVRGGIETTIAYAGPPYLIPCLAPGELAVHARSRDGLVGSTMLRIEERVVAAATIRLASK